MKQIGFRFHHRRFAVVCIRALVCLLLLGGVGGGGGVGVAAQRTLARGVPPSSRSRGD